MFKLKIISLIHVDPFNTMLPYRPGIMPHPINCDRLTPIFKQDLL